MYTGIKKGFNFSATKSFLLVGFIVVSLTIFPPISGNLSAHDNGDGECVLDIANIVDRTNAVPGDLITYNITISNTGTANCTGGGVKIQDLLDSNVEFINETHSSNFSAGYYGSVQNGNTLSWNGHEMIPGSSGTITVTARVKNPSACGDFSVSNTARASSNEYNWEWVNGTPVTTAINNACTPVVLPVCPFTSGENEYVVQFDTSKKLISNGSISDAMQENNSLSIPAGKYDVSLYSYDSYPARVNVAQPKEQWFLKLFGQNNEVIGISNPISDLADNVETATKNELVNSSLILSGSVVKGVAMHSAYLDTSSYNSVTAVCASLKKVAEPVNHAPVITIVGSNPFSFTVGDAFDSMAHATTTDPDGDVVTLHASSSVKTNVVGTYAVEYTAEDEHGLSAEPKTLTVIVTPKPTSTITLVADKIVCLTEASLPNWGNGGPDITATTASDYIATHADCHVVSGWQFEWGYDGIALDPGRDIIGQAGSGWNTFGDTDSNGRATTTVSIVDSQKIWVREVLKEGYIPFTFDQTHKTNANNVTAELYCNIDVLNYDNYEYIANMEKGKTYHCVAFNKLKEALPVNHAPVITIVGSNPFSFTVGDAFDSMAHATTTDPDGDVVTLHASSSVKTNVVGTYAVEYTAEDEHGLSAEPKTLVVEVLPKGHFPECSDGIDNDGDGKIDYPTDPGCDSTDDNDENFIPVAVLVAPVTAYKNATTTLDGIGSYDSDGTIVTYIWNFGDGSTELTTNAPASTTPHIFANLGTTTVTLKVTDNKGATSTVVVKDILIKDIPVYPECSDGIDNDGDGKIDYPTDPGCDSPTDDDENFIPIAVLVAPETAYKNISITLDGIGSYDLDGIIAKYVWNFGDGSAELTTFAPASTTPHLFTTLGTTTVTLKVTDNKNATSTVVTKDILVKEVPINPECSDGIDNDGDGKIDYPVDPGCDSPIDDDENAKPIAILSLDPTSSKPGISITNDGKNSYDTDGFIVLYEWTFGDGAVATSTASTTAHTYSTDNTYTVTLKVTDDKGATGSVTKTIVISTPVVPPPPPPPGCSGNCGGSVITPSLVITNETLEPGVIAGTSIVRWNTNIPADSRVVYGNSSVTSWTAGNQNYGYPKTTITVPALLTSHMMIIAGLDINTANYFRPISKTSSLSATGKELVSTPSTCYYLREFIKLGANNNPVEVKKLQVFLNEFEGAKLPVTGIYTQADFDAVVAFQNKYKTTVIDPWGETTRGYVYLTTKKQVNEIYCRAAFPLNGVESDEVNAYRALILGLQAQGIVVPTQEEVPNNQFVPQAGLVNGANDAMISLLKEEGKTPVLSATNTKTASVTNRGAIRNMFAGAYGAVSGAVASYWFVIILLALLIPTGFYAKKMLDEEDDDMDEAEPIL